MSNVSHTLHREIQAAKTLRAQLADILGTDEEFVAEAVEGQTSLNEAIDAVVEFLVQDYAAINGLDTMIEGFKRRRDRIEARIDNMRTALTVALEQAGRKKVEHPAVTLSLRAVPPSLQVLEESEIPAEFWRAGEPKLDRRSLLAALKDKREVAGCSLNNGGQTVAIKWG